MEKYNCQKIAEIGVFVGQNFNKLVKHNPEIAVAVDAWFDDKEVPMRNDSMFSQETLDKMCEDFKKWAADKPFVKIYREFTHDAVKHFPDEYFDFIYIDADHTYQGCKQDIIDWFPKVRKGGFCVGDDYLDRRGRVPGYKVEVVRAVNEFFKDKYQVYQLPRWGWAVIK